MFNCSMWPKEVSSAINTISNAFRKTHKINDLLIIVHKLNRYVKGQEAVTIKFNLEQGVGTASGVLRALTIL